MDNKEMKQINRKALPKFILMLVLSLVVGGCIGYFSAAYGVYELAGSMKRVGVFFGAHIAPWLMLALAVAVPAVCIPIQRSTRKLLAKWDGEDETIPDAADSKISLALWISDGALILSYFLIAASYSGGVATFDSRERTIVFFIGVIAFLAIMAETILIQQRCLDATRQINPEKQVSVYDMKFQKKWMDSCDEAEKVMIGKCAFKAYSTTNKVCTVLAIVLALGALLFEIGFLPSLAVCIIWIANLSVYCREAMQYNKAGSKIS